MRIVNHNEKRFLTGRIESTPNQLMHNEVLKPQFDYEVKHFLKWYIHIEKVLLLEYIRLNIISKDEAKEIADILNNLSSEKLIADPNVNMSDIAFGIESYTEDKMTKKIYGWHVDRSRNDLQSCAQLLSGREYLLEVIELMSDLGHSIREISYNTLSLPMPGYTHYQSAQIVTIGFYFSALSGIINETINRLLIIYSEDFQSPLGAGSMAGQELEWDRDRMAHLLGFYKCRPHALNSVASRDWLLKVSSELSNFSVNLSRFITDLIFWGSSEFNFIDLPDEMSGISSAMPQKKNFPILERIRGKTGHISSYYIDFVTGQRNTPYTNLVEVSKEAGANVFNMYKTMKSILSLTNMVIENLEFKEERILAASEKDFYGGFSLANKLTLDEKIPYRSAQVISGQYITEMKNLNKSPLEVDAHILESIALEKGYNINLSKEEIYKCFTIEHNLYGKKSKGSTNPQMIKELLTAETNELNRLSIEINKHKKYFEITINNVDILLNGQEG